MTDPSTPMPRRPSEPGPREARADFKALLARRVVVTLLGLMLLGLLAVGTYSVVVIRQTQVTNTVRANQRDETLQRVRDCTQPSGECYQRGQRQTAKAVGQIGAGNRAAAAAAATCAANMPNPTYSRVLRCMNATLARDQRP